VRKRSALKSEFKYLRRGAKFAFSFEGVANLHHAFYRVCSNLAIAHEITGSVLLHYRQSVMNACPIQVAPGVGKGRQCFYRAGQGPRICMLCEAYTCVDYTYSYSELRRTD
jgi:hypothetical protein